MVAASSILALHWMSLRFFHPSMPLYGYVTKLLDLGLSQVCDLITLSYGQWRSVGKTTGSSCEHELC